MHRLSSLRRPAAYQKCEMPAWRCGCIRLGRSRTRHRVVEPGPIQRPQAAISGLAILCCDIPMRPCLVGNLRR